MNEIHKITINSTCQIENIRQVLLIADMAIKIITDRAMINFNTKRPSQLVRKATQEAEYTHFYYLVKK